MPSLPSNPHKLSVSVLIFKMKKQKFRKLMSLAPGNTAPEDQNQDEKGAHQDVKPMSSCTAPLTGPTWILQTGFPHSSADKESACNAGDPCSIPGSGRSAGEGIGYPLQYSWASLVAQVVKNPPAMLETWVRSLGWKDPLEKGKVTHSSILGLPLWLN